MESGGDRLAGPVFAGLRPEAPDRMARALADVAGINAYFEISVGEPVGPGWSPLTTLCTDGAVLAALISDMGERLGTGETRVAASIWFQGLAARVWSPVLGAVLAHDLLIRCGPADLHWRAAESGPMPLRLAAPQGWRFDETGQVAEPLHRVVVTGILEPLVRAVREIVPIAPGLLWGNAASALAGTLGTLAGARPGTAARAVPLGRELLSRGVLRDTGVFGEGPPFVRRSCCLYYRVPGGGLCGDCVLLRR
ncbi:(2Fe-2S)-binding protein [Rhizohabitans arisaemae]|uniref:(2Fe-2S)-binding protein n=1 Tax=Rhizohabitans arisaemae TaxID=2720610 RepID=UPI0024B0D354|nr:(2Fe-2S)-binding protein [Rhizohabitans arisaemae]